MTTMKPKAEGMLKEIRGRLISGEVPPERALEEMNQAVAVIASEMEEGIRAASLAVFFVEAAKDILDAETFEAVRKEAGSRYRRDALRKAAERSGRG